MVPVDGNTALAPDLKQQDSCFAFIAVIQYDPVPEEYGQVRLTNMDSLRQFLPFPIHHLIFFGMAVITFLCHPSFHRRFVPVQHLFQTVKL